MLLGDLFHNKRILARCAPSRPRVPQPSREAHWLLLALKIHRLMSSVWCAHQSVLHELRSGNGENESRMPLSLEAISGKRRATNRLLSAEKNWLWCQTEPVIGCFHDGTTITKLRCV